jgi:hypothetical protein
MSAFLKIPVLLQASLSTRLAAFVALPPNLAYPYGSDKNDIAAYFTGARALRNALDQNAERPTRKRHNTGCWIWVPGGCVDAGFGNSCELGYWTFGSY